MLACGKSGRAGEASNTTAISRRLALRSRHPALCYKRNPFLGN